MNQLDQALRRGKARLRWIRFWTSWSSMRGFILLPKSPMEQHEFLFRHRARHEEFRKRLAEYPEAHKAGKPGVPVSLLFCMQAWMKEHLSQTDKLYRAFLNARGVR